MKNTSSYLKHVLLISILITGISVISRGQVGPGPPPTTPPPTTPGPVSGAPLDPLSWLVLGAGGAAAAGKYYQVRKKK